MVKRTFVARFGSLALCFGVVAGCNSLIGADPPIAASSSAGTGGGGKTSQPPNDNSGEGGTIIGEGGSSGEPPVLAGAGGHAVGGGSAAGAGNAAGENGGSGSGAGGGSAGSGAGGTSGGSAGGVNTGGSSGGACTDQACLKPPGTACSTTEECQTGVCGAEHVCCNVACSNTCTSCKLPGKPGICTAIDFSASSDASNCGDCGTVCSTSHITAACSSGKCGGPCDSGYANCSTTANDGCEVNTTNDAANCGGCGLKCTYGLCAGSACVSTVWGLTQHAGAGEALGTNSAGSILAVPLTIAFNTKLAAIGLRAYPPSTSVHMYLSLYTSDGTAPQALIAQTAELTMSDITSVGPTEGLIVSLPSIAAGSYFVVIMSDNLFHIQDELPTQTLTIWYNSAAVAFAPLSGAFPSSANMKTVSIPAPDAYIVTAP